MILGRGGIAFPLGPRGVHSLLAGLGAAFSLLLVGVACTGPGIRTAAFRISVVDADTGRGIPAVELRTNDDRSFFTDSAGVIALVDPDLVGRRVFFEVRSFGYEYERRSFGRPGLALDLAPGAAALLKMRRHNVAERLYRVTGTGIYRHSELLGDDVPLRGGDRTVVPSGMDSALATVYQGALFWIWGDTDVLSAPLGNLRATGARSQLPDRGGLDPRRGIELDFLLEGGVEGGLEGRRLRPMVEDDHAPIWLTALRATRNAEGEERLFATYAKIEKLMTPAEQGLALFDDETGRFRIRARYPRDAPIVPTGVVFRHTDGGRSRLYYDLYVRSLDTAEGVRDLSSYEAYTPLRHGERIPADGVPDADALARDADGSLVWDWKRDTAAIPPRSWKELVRTGVVEAREAPYRLIDIETGEALSPHGGGSIHWNEHRQRWIMIRSRAGGGGSLLGEVYYFEAETPLGPWAYGRKIVTHSMPAPSWTRGHEHLTYSFYNPVHHPELDRAQGREILFEGTMSVLFAHPAHPRIPGYNYNQMMYGLDLEDPRLFLPVAVYSKPGRAASHRTRSDEAPPDPSWELAFFAPDRPRPGTVPLYAIPDRDGHDRLVAGGAAHRSHGPARFHCATEEPPPPATVPLYERREAGQPWTYGIGPPPPDATILCHVWTRPVDFPPELRHPPAPTAGPAAPLDPTPRRREEKSARQADPSSSATTGRWSE